MLATVSGVSVLNPINAMDIGRWIESLLNSNLSTYFDGDARIDLRRGEIEIGPLELKPASLLHSEAAFELRAGHVGKVRIQLPGARSLISWLGEQPPVLDVHVETALVVFGLPTKREWGAEQYAQEAAAKRARHQAAIAAAEQILQGLISGHSDPDAKGRLGSFLRGGSFFSRQLLRVLEHLVRPRHSPATRRATALPPTRHRPARRHLSAIGVRLSASSSTTSASS